MPMTLNPADCLIRICRNCIKPMTSSYEWDSEYRWYYFHCESCGFDVTVGENISQYVRELNLEDGDYLEPLTKEEMIEQTESKAELFE